MENLLFDFDDLLNLYSEPEKRVNIKKNLPMRIATVLDSERASELYLQFMRGRISESDFDEGLESCILERGMTKEEIERYFPPVPQHREKLSFNRTSLIASIIWEERELVGKNRRPGNVRHFWYTNLMYTLMKVMKDTTNIVSINCTYQQVLTNLVKYEGFRYSDLNLTSNKSELCEALFKDSPYPNVIIACEKESYHDHLKRLANIFHITFISLGGQGSYKVYEDLVVDFINAGIDINQEFHIFTISDFDPQGYCIQDTAKEHLERAGIRKVTIHRVYICPEHITKGIVERHAVPYVWRKKSNKGDKGALTTYNNFGKRTGGIYKCGEEWQYFSQNGDGSYDVPIFRDSVDGYELFRVELDNFRDEVLLQLLIDTLADFMDGSEYYYKKAQDYVNELFQQKWRNVADRIASEKVKNLLCDEYETVDSLGRRLRQLSFEFTSDVDELEQAVDNDYEYRYNLIEEQIEELQEQISSLESSQSELEYRRDGIKHILHDIFATKRKGITTLEKEVETKIDDPLRCYEIDAQEEMKDEIYRRLQKDGFRAKEWVNFMEKNNDIFKKAREGAETFDVNLDWTTKRTIESKLDDKLRDQEKELIKDESISMPELPDEIRSISQVAKDILDRIENVKEDELSEKQGALFKALKRLFDEGVGDRLYYLWQTNDLYEFLNRYAD